MTTPDPQTVHAALREAVEGTLRRFGELPARYVLVVETLSASDGDRGLWTAASEGAKPWDTLGLLSCFEAAEREKYIRAAFRDDD